MFEDKEVERLEPPPLPRDQATKVDDKYLEGYINFLYNYEQILKYIKVLKLI